jgi:hypothetical protein
MGAIKVGCEAAIEAGQPSIFSQIKSQSPVDTPGPFDAYVAAQEN